MAKTRMRPGMRSGVRTEFTVMAKVLPGHEQAIREAIQSSFGDPRRDQVMRELGTLHEARHVLFDDDTRYLFASSFDGDWDKYVHDFAGSFSGVVLDRILSHCEDYPGLHSPGLKDWIADHQSDAVAFAVAYPEATVRQIWRALALQRAFEHVLDDPEASEALAVPTLEPLRDLAAA